MPLLLDQGQAPGSKLQVGLYNVDSGEQETKIRLPVPSERASWLYYDITLGCVLDSGIVVHRALPQVDNTADTLASCDITDPNIDVITGRGVNLISNDSFTDAVQRMAHSQYWFRLWGQAMRIGEQVPIPQLKSVAGVTAVPHDKNPQWAYNRIAGNYSGQVLYHAQWSLWYTLASAPNAQQPPLQNLAQHIAAGGDKSDSMQAPWTLPDDDAVPSGPPQPAVFQSPVR